MLAWTKCVECWQVRVALTAHQLATLDHVGVRVIYGNIEAQGLQDDVLIDHQLLRPLQVALCRHQTLGLVSVERVNNLGKKGMGSLDGNISRVVM